VLTKTIGSYRSANTHIFMYMYKHNNTQVMCARVFLTKCVCMFVFKYNFYIEYHEGLNLACLSDPLEIRNSQ